MTNCANRVSARTERYLRGETVEFTTQIRRIDGALRWIEVKNRPIADPSTGKFTRLVGVAIDITERKQAADALRRERIPLSHRGRAHLGLRLRIHGR